MWFPQTRIRKMPLIKRDGPRDEKWGTSLFINISNNFSLSHNSFLRLVQGEEVLSGSEGAAK